jgi:superoxide dismutase
LVEVREKGDHSAIFLYAKNLAFHLGGHQPLHLVEELVPRGILPLLQVDIWEHAHYLQYKNVKADYVKAFWKVVNRADVEKRYAAATTKTNGLIFG